MFFGVFSFCTLKASANISSICPPSSRVSPFCHTAEPYGQGNTRRAHVSRRRLIMSLVALVQKNHSAPATSYSRLVLGTRFGRRHCSSNSVFEQVSAYIRTPRTNCGCLCLTGEFVQLREAVNKSQHTESTDFGH